MAYPPDSEQKAECVLEWMCQVNERTCARSWGFMDLLCTLTSYTNTYANSLKATLLNEEHKQPR